MDRKERAAAMAELQDLLEGVPDDLDEGSFVGVMRSKQLLMTRHWESTLLKGITALSEEIASLKRNRTFLKDIIKAQEFAEQAGAS